MWFPPHEYQERLARCRALMHDNDYDYLLVLEPENVTYLTAFFTEGYNTSFQFAVIPSEGDPVVVARTAEKFWLDRTCPYANRAILWNDGETAAEVTTRALREIGADGCRVGVEAGSWRANTAYLSAVFGALPRVDFADVGLEVSRLRFLKSPREIELIRRAGRVAETMMDAAIAEAQPGVRERAFAASVASCGMRAGSDWAHPGPISSGEAAKHIHANYADRVFEPDDLVFVEVTPQIGNYHARFMRSIKIGRPTRAVLDLASRLLDVQDRALAEVRAGVSCRVPDRTYREGILATGAVDSYPNKTFYGVGLLLLPNTFEPLEVTASSDFEFQAGMTFHTYLVVAGLNFSETITVTDGGYERLTGFRRELLAA